MAETALRRFSEVGLGETVEVSATAVADAGWEERAIDLVRDWSGSGDIRLTYVLPPHPAARPRNLSGRIFARHLDDRRLVDVEVYGWDRGALCARAIVRAALA